MSNLQHGLYSENPQINPDSIMIQNSIIKKKILMHHFDIIDVVEGKIVKPGVTDLVCRLIESAYPDNLHLLPKGHSEEIESYYNSPAFKVIKRCNSHKSTLELVRTYEDFNR